MVFASGGVFSGVAVEWNIHLYYHWLPAWELHDEGELMFISRQSGKTQIGMMHSKYLLMRHQAKMQQIGPNLRRLHERVNRRARKRAKAKELRPARQEWRRQERLRSNRLPGR